MAVAIRVVNQAGPLEKRHQKMCDKVRELGRALQEHGHRLTTSRRIILEMLVESGGHISADELAALVGEQNTGVSRMTIYRTLDLLCDLGYVRPIYHKARAARFVLLEDGGHHHFLCSGCDRVIEIDECVIDDLLARLRGERRLQINSHLLELYGLCDSCQQLEQSQTSRRADYQLK